MNLKNQIFHGSNFQCISPANYTPVNQHSNGKWTLWRCISYSPTEKWVIFQQLLFQDRAWPGTVVIPRDLPRVVGSLSVIDRSCLIQSLGCLKRNHGLVWFRVGWRLVKLVGDFFRYYEAYECILMFVDWTSSSRWDFMGWHYTEVLWDWKVYIDGNPGLRNVPGMDQPIHA